MRITIIGTADECELAIAALSLLLDVREVSAAEPAEGGLVRVEVLILEPESPGYVVEYPPGCDAGGLDYDDTAEAGG